MQLNKEVKPKIINDTIDIKENLKYIENKLQKHNKTFFRHIAHGRNYFFYQFNGEDRFISSRFVTNPQELINFEKKVDNIRRHAIAINYESGSTTINNILGFEPVPSADMEKRLETFLKKILPNEKAYKKHYFWITDISLNLSTEQITSSQELIESDLYNKAKEINNKRRVPLDLSNYGEIKIIPPKTSILISHYTRNPQVVADALWLANGICEGCGNKTFQRASDGEFYLEVHHKKPLSENGSDTLDNTCAICPTCHRLLHYGTDKDKKKILRQIKNSREKNIKRIQNETSQKDRF